MTDSTADQQPASLEDELAAAYDSQESGAEVDDTPDLEAPPASKKDAEDAAENDIDAAEQASNEGEQPGGIEAPQHWPSELRKRFESLPQDAQEFVMDRHRDMEADYTRKTQELAEQRRQVEQYAEFDRMLQPYQQRWAQRGMTPGQAINQLLAYGESLEQDPKGTLLTLAQRYGVDLQQAYEDQPYVDPNTQKLEQQLQQLQQSIAQRDQQTQQQQQQALLAQIQGFAEATDAEGKPLRPYFQDVQDDMARLMQLGHVERSPAGLQQAYEMAVQYNPKVREKLEQEQQQQAQAARQAEAKRAKSASAGVRSKSTGDDRPDKSIRDDLAEQLEAAGFVE